MLAQSSLALRDGSVVIRTEDCTRPINQTLLQEGPASRGLQKTQDALLFGELQRCPMPLALAASQQLQALRNCHVCRIFVSLHAACC